METETNEPLKMTATFLETLATFLLTDPVIPQGFELTPPMVSTYDGEKHAEEPEISLEQDPPTQNPSNKGFCKLSSGQCGRRQSSPCVCSISEGVLVYYGVRKERVVFKGEVGKIMR